MRGDIEWVLSLYKACCKAAGISWPTNPLPNRVSQHDCNP
jgi:hypothetical protein